MCPDGGEGRMDGELSNELDSFTVGSSRQARLLVPCVSDNVSQVVRSETHQVEVRRPGN